MSAQEHMVQLTYADWDRHGPALTSAHPDAHWLIVGEESLTLDGAEIDWADAVPTIVWFGFDGIQSAAKRRHFGLATTCDSVRYALTSYAGLDDSYWSALHDRGVIVTNAHLSGVPISQFIMARVLEWYHRPIDMAATRAAKSWSHHRYPEIDGSTWIVVGLGAIGTNVARRARAFGAHVIAARREITGHETDVDEVVTLNDLPNVAERADVMVFAVPDSHVTRDLVDARFLEAMKPTAALVNVGRGTLIVETDLLEALDHERLGVAILDVTRVEPLPEGDPLWTHPRVLLSPHTAAGGINRHARSRDLFIDNLDRIFSGQLPAGANEFGTQSSRPSSQQ